MTVKELINSLKTVPQNALIVLSKDAEGNGYSPLADIGHCQYIMYNKYSLYLVPLEEAEKDSKECICFWPTN